MSEQVAEQSTVVELPKLVDWKNPPTVAQLKKDMLAAKPTHDAQVAKIAAWLDNLNVEGKAKPDVPKGQSQVQPKLIRKQAEWRYPALSEPFLSTRELFKAEPISWEDVEAARQNVLVLNNQFNTKIDKQQFIDDYVHTVVDEGTAIIRVGWEFEEEEVEEEQPVVQMVPDPTMQPLMEELTQMLADNPTGYQHEVPLELQWAHEESLNAGIAYRPTVIGQQTVKVRKTVVNQPTLEICDYRNVIIDPTAKGNIKKAGFIIYSFESSLSEVKKDGRYKNLEHINLTTNSILGEPDHATDNATDFNFSDKARQKFVVHEYWGYWDIDGSGRTRPFVAAWVGDVLIRLEESPFPDKGLPFVKVQYLPKRRSNYGEPDGHLLEDNQKIVGAVTRGMIDLMGKSANAQTGTRKGALDATNRRRFEKGQDYEFNGNTHPEQIIYMHTYPEIPASAQFMVELQNFEAESLTGVKAFSGGLSGEGLGDVAAGIRGVLDAASKRELSILRRLKQGLIEVARKIIAMNAVFLDEEEVVRVTNDTFVTVRRDDLAGKFDLDLDISTVEEDTAKAQQLAFMLQTLGPNEDPAIRKMILAKIAQLQKMPDLAKRFEDYQPQPDPLMQQKVMLEIELLKAQVANEYAKAGKQQSGAQLDQAKVQETLAHAADLQGSADLKTLDFVEQETGVKQERELQQHGAQAAANMVRDASQHERKKELEAYKARFKAKTSDK